MTRRLSALLASAALLALPGCGYLPSWAGGKTDSQPKVTGERIAALPAGGELQPDPALQTSAVALPAARKNESWPQHTGSFAAENAHLSGGAFDTIASARVGEGESFEHTLVTRPVAGGGMVFAMDAAGGLSAHVAGNIEEVRWRSKSLTQEDETSALGGGLAYDQGRLYAVSGQGLVAALDASTGQEVWRKALRVPFRSPPVVSGGRLLAVTLDNQIFALNAADGEVIWSQRGISETAGLMAAVSPAVAGEAVVAPYSSGEIYVLAAADGKEIWSDSLSSGKRSQASSLFSGIGGDPVVDGGVVITVSSGGVLAVHALATGQRAWERLIGSTNTPWLAGDYLFVLTTDSTLACLVKFDGRVRWATKLPAFEDEARKKDPILWKGPVLVDGKLALVSPKGRLLLVNAADGSIADTKVIPEDVYTAPVVAGGRLYLAGQDARLYELQ